MVRRIDEYSAVLVVEHISSEHSGNYTCIAANAAGVERFTVPVTVNVPPKWIVQPKDTSVQAGQVISVHCQADGYPTPVITWSECTFHNVFFYLAMAKWVFSIEILAGSGGFTVALLQRFGDESECTFAFLAKCEYMCH